MSRLKIFRVGVALAAYLLASSCSQPELPASILSLAENKEAIVVISDNACLSCSKKFVEWLSDDSEDYQEVLLIAEANPSAIDLSMLMDKPHFYFWWDLIDKPYKKSTMVAFKSDEGQWEYYFLDGVHQLSLFEEEILDRLMSI